MSLFLLDHDDRSTALAFCCFNRPAHAELGLSRLAACADLDRVSIAIFQDGPRRDADLPGVEATRKVAEAWAARLGARLTSRDANQGLARSIVGAADACLREHGRVIVLEDDLVARPDFVTYMLAGLDACHDDHRVLQVCGYMAPIELDGPPDSPDALFLPLTSTWGWATWRRAWQLFDFQPPSLPDALDNPVLTHAFDLHGTYPYAAMLADRLAGRNDSWGILWWWTVFLVGGYCLHPRKSLVWVGGMDGSGTHCLDAPDIQGRLPEDFQQPAFPGPPRLPTLGEIAQGDEMTMNRLRAYIRMLCSGGK